MRLDHLWLADFRNYTSAELTFPPGLLAITGDNGAGKTNVLEAIGFLATQSSFRGVPNEALVRTGAGAGAPGVPPASAIVRGEGERNGRALLIEAEIRAAGRGRATINRQPVRRSADLASALLVSVFSPDDLDLVKEGPTGRRRYLDDTLAALHPRHEAARRDFERILRQRNALLAQVAAARGRLTDETATTLEVWDTRLATTGEAVAAARADLVSRLAPALTKAYAQVSSGGDATIAYDAPWREHGLAEALRRVRPDELRRGVSLVGPHRDELLLHIVGPRGPNAATGLRGPNAATGPRKDSGAETALPARTHASQGEQRSLALALRLAAHHVVTEAVGEPPLLLLDDVFSELDPTRSAALIDHLPEGQAVLTTTGAIPAGAVPERTVRVTAGRFGP